MRQLTKFVSKITALPDQLDVAFIVNFEKSPRNQKDEKYFRIFISTRRLLGNAVNSSNVHADATHKVTTERIPLIAVGVTDPNKCFHFSGMTLCTKEQTDDFAFTFDAMRQGVEMVTGVRIQPNILICDADTAIHKGFKQTFTDSADKHLIIMCYFHVLLNIRMKYKFDNAKNKPKFMDDVRKLHLCDSERKFDVGCQLFVMKWIGVEPKATKVIKKSFFKAHKNWFIGVVPRTPKHNNGLETFNSTMKRCQTEHQRQPLKQFLSSALAIVRQRSKEYLKDKLPYEYKLNIEPALYEKGRTANVKFVHTEECNNEVDFYTFRSGMEQVISLGDVIQSEKAEYNTFDEFKAKAFDIWKITFPIDGDNWIYNAHCSCPAFDLDYMCKHILSIANSCGISDTTMDSSSEDYDDEPLFVSKRGRPKRTSLALVRE